jgi:hypothetical protein
VIAHTGVPGAAPFVAMGLFVLGIGAAVGAFAVSSWHRTGFRKPARITLGVVAVGCLGVATVLPLVLHATPTAFGRPSTSARLQILSPTPGETFEATAGPIPVRLRLVGGTIVPISSLHLLPNKGHIHLSLDGALVSMTGLAAGVAAGPGPHVLQAEFVAVDHHPFQPRVIATVAFRVDG